MVNYYFEIISHDEDIIYYDKKNFVVNMKAKMLCLR